MERMLMSDPRPASDPGRAAVEHLRELLDLIDDGPFVTLEISRHEIAALLADRAALVAENERLKAEREAAMRYMAGRGVSTCYLRSDDDEPVVWRNLSAMIVALEDRRASEEADARIESLTRDAATTGEPVAWMVEMANALAMAVRELSASRLRAHEPAFSTALGGVMAKADDLRTRGYSRPDPQVAALTEEREGVRRHTEITAEEIRLVREQGEVLVSSYEQPGARRQPYEWHDGKTLIALAAKLAALPSGDAPR